MNKIIQSFISFLPRGRLFRAMRREESNMYKFADSITRELSRLNDKIDSVRQGLFLITEDADALSYWLRLTGLNTYSEVLSQIRKRGGTSRPVFIETLMANGERGQDSDLFEFRPLRAGLSKARDACYNSNDWRFKFGLRLRNETTAPSNPRHVVGFIKNRTSQLGSQRVVATLADSQVLSQGFLTSEGLDKKEIYENIRTLHGDIVYTYY